MTKLNQKLRSFLFYSIFSFAILFALNSCEDSGIIDYEEQTLVEAFIYVGQPIENIQVLRSQPITDTFNYERAMIRDAEVIIKEGSNEYKLKIDAQGEKGYYFEDKNYLIKPDTKYNLEIRLKNGGIITGETTTPPVMTWQKELDKYLQYPADTSKNKLKDSIAWDKLPKYDFYIVAVKCLDTLNYGSLLEPATSELNARLENSFREENFYKDRTSLGFIANSKTPVVWSVFKWYGSQEISIIAPDYNMLRWFLQVQSSREYVPLLASVEGTKALGVFGSGSAVRDKFTLLKPQN